MAVVFIELGLLLEIALLLELVSLALLLERLCVLNYLDSCLLEL